MAANALCVYMMITEMSGWTRVILTFCFSIKFVYSYCNLSDTIKHNLSDAIQHYQQTTPMHVVVVHPTNEVAVVKSL